MRRLYVIFLKPIHDLSMPIAIKPSRTEITYTYLPRLNLIVTAIQVRKIIVIILRLVCSSLYFIIIIIIIVSSRAH